MTDDAPEDITDHRSCAPSNLDLAELILRNSSAIAELREELFKRRASPMMPIYWLLSITPGWHAALFISVGDLLSTNPVYAAFKNFGSDRFWAMIAGSIAYLAVLCGVSHDKRLIAAGAFLIALWHTTISVFFFAAVPTSLGTATNSVLAAVAMIVMWRVR